MYWNVAVVMHYSSCVLLNTGLYFLVVCNLGFACMYILRVSNPAVAAKLNKPLLQHFQ